MSLADDAVTMATELEERGVKPCTADPRKAAGLGKCVLVAPPAYDYTTKAATWTLVCLSGRTAADLDTFKVLAELLELVADAAPVEQARPSVYQLTSDTPPVPAYLVTLIG